MKANWGLYTVLAVVLSASSFVLCRFEVIVYARVSVCKDRMEYAPNRPELSYQNWGP